MEKKENHGTTKGYVIGFILSIVLTIIPIELVMNHMMNKTTLTVSIVGAAVLQFVIQLFLFMHIRSGEKPRYNILAVILGLVMVFTIVVASMWVMTFSSQVA